MKFDIGSFVFTMVLLYVGGFASTYITPMLPLEGWVTGLVTAMIQVLILGLAGILTKQFDLVMLLVCGIAIFIGGIVGGLVASWMGMTGLMSTIILLAIQTLILSLTGYMKRGKSKIV